MERRLRITGKGHLAVTPDIIILSFSAEVREWEYEKAITALNQKVEELRVVVENQGVERKNLKTKDFKIRKDTVWNKKTGDYDFNGFKASHQLELELPLDKAIINALLSQVAKGISHLDFSISFGVKDPTQHQQALILLAITKAKENAITITNGTGVALKEILDIDYSFHEMVIRSERHDYPVYHGDMLMETQAASVDFEPDDIQVNETITITWRIE